MTIEFCNKVIPSRSRYSTEFPQRCYLPPGHRGKCNQFPHLEELRVSNPSVAEKIKRDSTMTTGASWKSSDAGPNRILRWVMLLPNDALEEFGIPISSLSTVVEKKLRDKAASYDDCMAVSRKLTWSAYSMAGSPEIGDLTRTRLEEEFGKIEKGSTVCLICRNALDFGDFANARRGRADIETAHAMPRSHNPDNVGFAHRTCNIAQGDKTLDEFYRWIRQILENVDADKNCR